MLDACQPDSPLVHEEWGDNIFVEFSEDGPIEEAAKAAAIKVTRQIRTARHCMFPIEGRGVIAYRDARLRLLTLITSTQFPHSVQTGLSECLGIEHGRLRIISPDVGGGFGYKGLLCREEVALGWLALRGRPSGALAGGQPRASDRERQLPRASLSDHRLCDRRRQAPRYRLHRPCRCRRLFVLSDFIVARGGANCQPAAGALRVLGVPLPLGGGRHQQVSDPAVPRRRPHRRLPRDRNRSWTPSPGEAGSNPTRSGCATWFARNRCRSTTSSANISTAAIIPKCLRLAVEAIGLERGAAAAEASRAGRAPDRRRALLLRRAGRARARPCSAPGAGRSCPATSRPM